MAAYFGRDESSTTRSKTSHVTRSVGASPEPSCSTTPVVGMPRRTSSWRTRAVPMAVVAGAVPALPTAMSRSSSSAV